MRVLLAAAAALLLAAPAVSTAQSRRAAEELPSSVLAAVRDPSRSAEDRARDVPRRAFETLVFAQVRPGQTVVDFWPGGGYFTRLLSRAVGPTGKVYAIQPKELEPLGPRFAERLAALGADPATPNVTPLSQLTGEFAPPEPVDLIFTAQNYHDFYLSRLQGLSTEAFNARAFRVLKPGGVYLIVDHVAPAGSPLSVADTLHRIDPEVIKREVTAAGFVFEGELNVLRRTDDDYSLSVFDPKIRGETDQVIYRFRKPRGR